MVVVMNEGGKKALEKSLEHFFSHQIKLKLYHFQTNSYGAHKASDAYLTEFLANFDLFMEVAQGIYGKLETSELNISFETLNDNSIMNELDDFVEMLAQLSQYIVGNTDLLNIKDEMIAEANKLKYLLTFK